MLLLHVFFQIRFQFTKVSAKNTSLSNINHSIAIKVLISNKHYSQEQNSTSHETFMASSEVILKVTKTRKSVLHPSQGRTYKCFMHTVVEWIPLLGVIDFVATFLAFKIHSCSYWALGLFRFILTISFCGSSEAVRKKSDLDEAGFLGWAHVPALTRITLIEIWTSRSMQIS